MKGERLFKLSTIADEADLSLKTVQKHVRDGALPFVRVGPAKLIRVTESEKKKYLGDVKGGE